MAETEVVELADRIFLRSLHALRDLEVRLLSGPEVQIGLKAYANFSAQSCVGRTVWLRVHTIFGIRDVRGHLAAVTASPPWYGFLFQPENPNELLFVLEWEMNRTTNIERVTFEHDGTSSFMNNPFFKDVSRLAE